jgi:hypothetical protein
MRRDFRHGDVPSANHDGFPFLDLIDDAGKMGFSISHIPCLHGRNVSRKVGHVNFFESTISCARATFKSQKTEI